MTEENALLKRDVLLVNEPCTCGPDECAQLCDPPSGCINRLSGDVRTLPCDKHNPTRPGHLTYTWHQDGECLRCRHDKALETN